MAFKNTDTQAPFNVVDNNGNIVGTLDVSGLKLFAANGSKIVLDPTQVQPVIQFFSPDGTNDAFINAVNNGTPNRADLGLNSGRYAPVSDGVGRRIRVWLADSADLGVFQVIEETTQNNAGGKFQVQSNGAFMAFKNIAAGIDNSLIIDANRAFLNVPLVATNEVWTPIPLQNGWVNRGGIGAPLSVRKVVSPPNAMLIVGHFVPGTTTDGTVIGILPVGYRPVSEQIILARRGGGAGGTPSATIGLEPDGTIRVFDVAGSALVQMSPTTVVLDW